MSNGIGKNPLLDISEVYLQQIASQETQEEGYKPIDRKKENAMYRRAGNLARTSLSARGKKKEDAQDKSSKIVSAISRQKEKERFDKMGDEKARDNYKEALDPVGREDADIDNDGDVDKSDKYLGKRRKAIAKAMKKRMKKEEVVDEQMTGHGKRLDTYYHYDMQDNDKKPSDIKNRTIKGKKPSGTVKVKNEGFSNWRNELVEVAPMKDDEEKEIKEKKVKNKVTINPKLGEEVVSEMGGTLIEMVEYDEFDGMVEGVYFELQEEGYEQDDIEEALEWVLTEAKVTYGHDTESPRQQMMKKAKGRLKFMKRKAGEALSSVKKKAGEKITSAKKDAAQAQVDAYNKGRELKQKAGDKVRGAKTGIKAKIKRVAQKVVDRMSEEAEVDPKEKQMLAKKKTMMMKQQMLDKQRMQMQQQGKLPSGHRVEQKEEMSIKDQMRISREAAAKRKPYEPGDREKQRAAQLKQMAKNSKKDTRTDAERMADATGPRKGSNYRGD